MKFCEAALVPEVSQGPFPLSDGRQPVHLELEREVHGEHANDARLSLPNARREILQSTNSSSLDHLDQRSAIFRSRSSLGMAVSDCNDV